MMKDITVLFTKIYVPHGVDIIADILSPREGYALHGLFPDMKRVSYVAVMILIARK